jgi:DNA modification methylase
VIDLSKPFRAKVFRGDCLDVLRQLPDNTLDAAVTDPPYGLGKEPDAEDMLKAWLSGLHYSPGQSGFMGAEWDSFVPGPHIWREVYRVLKPGGWIACFAGAKTVDLMGLSLRLAGFESRGTISWVQSKGLPKGRDTSKRIDEYLGTERAVVGFDASRVRPNRLYTSGSVGALDDTGNVCDRTENGATITAPGSSASAEWSDFGDDLSPSHEPIILARKPLDGTIAEHVLKWGTGVLNIGACRTKGTDETSTHSRGAESAVSKGVYGDSAAQETHQNEGQKKGRHPKDFLLTHAPECVRIGDRRVKAITGTKSGSWKTGGQYSGGYRGADEAELGDPVGLGDADGNEIVSLYACVPWCAVRTLADVNGVKKSGIGAVKRKAKDSNVYGADDTLVGKKMTEYGDEGTVDRFFPTFDWAMDADDLPMFYETKVSPKDRDEGLEPVEGQKRVNNHITVKPLRLMSWVLRLVTPPGGKVIDPFLGSGTTACAALIEGFPVIGIEREGPYAEIAKKRVAYWYAKTKPPTPAPISPTNWSNK